MICEDCKHEFEYDDDQDVFGYADEDMDGNPFDVRWVSCPNCHERTYLR